MIDSLRITTGICLNFADHCKTPFLGFSKVPQVFAIQVAEIGGTGQIFASFEPGICRGFVRGLMPRPHVHIGPADSVGPRHSGDGVSG